MAKPFHRGDPVIYRKQKYSTHPGPRAREVRPARSGEEYTYQVNKFWVVKSIEADGSVVVSTRRGKEHRLTPDDPRLSHPKWWEAVWYRNRFPPLPEEK